MKVEKTCPVCGKLNFVELSDEQAAQWKNSAGVHVQNIHPMLSVNDCEILISGTCSKCYDSLFSSEEDSPSESGIADKYPEGEVW